MNQPKLLLVADTYYPKVDGTLRFIEEFIKRGEEFNISLLVPDLGKKKGKNVVYIQPSKLISLSGYPNLKFSFRNLRLIKEEVKKADIIFVQGPATISYLATRYGHRQDKKTIFYIHVLSWELLEKFMPTTILKKIMYKLVKIISIHCFNYCDRIIVPYPGLKEQLVQAGVKTEIVVARLGVDIEKFSPAKNKAGSKKGIGIDSSKTVIGYVGRISKEKNVLVLLEAFKKLEQQENLHLLIVGDGPKELIAQFRELKNCTVTGFVDQVQEYLKAMDVFVMPSLTETTSLATLEAMASGLPVIVTKVGYMKNYVIKEHNGIFFPKNSSTVLAMKIKKLIEEPGYREKLGTNARKTVAYSFSWERSINKIKRILLKQYYS
ncbi:MAG TPA: glycosyltransferase [Candidatus Nanoarchaeia archaeon]|nr:glycosyltransferase [Candidatus Nanoarchaeia archaeon]